MSRGQRAMALLSYATPLHSLADQNDAKAVLRRQRTLMSAGDDDLGNRDLEELAALRHRGDVPHLAAIGDTQGVEVEVRWRSEFVQFLEDGVTLGLQAFHHPIPTRKIISGGELASDIPRLFQVHDPAANGVQAGLENGALAFAFRHGELPPALGDGAKDGIIRLHRAKPKPELPHDFLVGVADLDVGPRRTVVAEAGTAASIIGGSVAADWLTGHGEAAGVAASHPNEEGARRASTASLAPGPMRPGSAFTDDRRAALQLGQHPRVLPRFEDAVAEADRVTVRSKHDPAIVFLPPHKSGIAQNPAKRRDAPRRIESSPGLSSCGAHLSSR